MNDEARNEMRKSWTGYVGLTIKARDTEENQAVLDMFREYCQVETQDNYTQGLRRLLENTKQSYLIEELYARVAHLEAEMEALNAPEQEKQEQVGF
jgi:hypothetical protein